MIIQNIGGISLKHQDNPGAVVVVKRVLGTVFGRFRIVVEYEDDDVMALVRKAGELTETCDISRWYGDRQDGSGLLALRRYWSSHPPKERRFSPVTSRIITPDDAGIRVLFPILKEFIGSMVLNIEDAPRFTSYLEQATDISAIRWGQYPLVEAAAMAFAEFHAMDDREYTKGGGACEGKAGRKKPPSGHVLNNYDRYDSTRRVKGEKYCNNDYDRT